MFANCNNQDEALDQKKIASSDGKGLIVTLFLNDSIVSTNSEIQITARFYNNGEKDIKLDQRQILENPILSLRVSDEKGNALHSVPPSIPRDDKNSTFIKILKPEEDYTIKYNLNIFSPALSKGRYSVNMKNGSSNKVWFDIE